MTQADADLLIADAIDLIDNKKFKPFFYKTLYMIGRQNFQDAMSYARKEPDIKCRPCIFVKRLKMYRDRLTKDSGNNRISVG